MTAPGPEQPQPRDIALEQPAPEQLDELEAASEPEQPAGDDDA